ncbi:unnamed protein product [Laminaria digitata]
MGMGWFGGSVTRESQERTRHVNDYRVHFEVDQSTRSMKLPLEMYSGDPDAEVGSWVLLERSTAEQVDEVGAAATLGVSRAGRVRTANVTLVDQEGWELLHEIERVLTRTSQSGHKLGHVRSGEGPLC